MNWKEIAPGKRISLWMSWGLCLCLNYRETLSMKEESMEPQFCCSAHALWANMKMSSETHHPNVFLPPFQTCGDFKEVHIYTGILLSHYKNEIDVDGLRVCSTDWSKSERKTNIYWRTYVEPRKIVQMNLFPGQELRCRCRKHTCGHTG